MDAWKDFASPQESIMDATTLLIILIVLLVLGGGGHYGRRRWFWTTSQSCFSRVCLRTWAFAR